MSCDPHIKDIKRSDPVSKYQSYQKSWQSYRAPGEKLHKQLRWAVRDKMLYHDTVVDKVINYFIYCHLNEWPSG